jgi:monoterpene epsilon-lactone hydrolase
LGAAAGVLSVAVARWLPDRDPHPRVLQVGTNELLLDDSVRLAERARDAEVDVILDVTAGVPHVFPSFVGTLDEAGQALDRAALFIRQHP